MEALWLKSQGLKHKEICKLTKISSNTLRNYIKEYLKGGIEELRKIKFYKPQSTLKSYKGTLEVYFREQSTCHG
jgi:transposase